jgi:hypothetical protein
MSDPADKKPEEKEVAVPPNQTRTGIQLMLEPVIDSIIKGSGLDMTNPDILRRYFRALTHLAIKKLLDVGAPPDFLLAQTIEAITHELESRQKLSGPTPVAPSVPPGTMMN